MEEFIEKIEKLNLFLVKKDKNLVLRGRTGTLDKNDIEKIKKNDEIIGFIKENKQSLLTYLNEKAVPPSFYKLSPLQSGMLFHSLYDNNSSAYTVQFSLDFVTGIDLSSVRAAWGHLMKNHSILRTAFSYEELNVPIQFVHENVKPPVFKLDYSMYSSEERAKKIKQFLETDTNTPFELTEAPLFRATYIRLNEVSYKMVFTTHHIILDGWSLSILMGAFMEAYSMFQNGTEPPKQEEDLYGDYIKYISKKDSYEEEAFWKNYMQGLEYPSLLPFSKATLDRNKGAGDYNNITLSLDCDATKKLTAFAKTNHYTVNTLIQGVWAILIAKYTGNTNVVYGVTVSGRPTDMDGAEEKVGLYINTLPLHAEWLEDKNITDWLKDIQISQMDCRDHQYTSLTKIQGLIDIKKDLFDSIVVFENYPMSNVISDSEEGSLAIDNLTFNEQTNYPLGIVVGLAEELLVKFDYNSTLLDFDTVSMIKNHFQRVLEQITSEAVEKLGDISILTVAEEYLILEEFNATQTVYSTDKTIVSIFEDQAAKTPDAVALVFENNQITYGELNRKSNQLAHYLVKQGVTSEDLVGVCIERSMEALIVLLGILKSGGAYVPIDSGYPTKRIHHMLADTNMKVLLVTNDTLKIEKTIKTVVLAKDWEKIQTESTQNLHTDIKVDQLAYIMYTSGSTGTPKGVMVEHMNIVSLAMSCDYVPLNNHTKWLSTGSISFDATTIEFWGTLLNGGTLILTDTMTLLNATSLKQSIDENQANTMWMTASWFHQMVEEDISVFENIQYLLVGGDRVLYQYTNKLKARFPSITIVNGYGPTENTTFSTSHTIEANCKSDLPIGKPINNRQAYILDASLNRVQPVGVVGELCLGGDGLARGYLNQPELTNEKFIEHPFKAYERLYCTGDMARLLPDGTIEFVGRKDEQVKIRGYRIELSAIENVLSIQENVKGCCILAKEDAKDNKRLIGYVVVKNDQMDKELLQDALKEYLPDYMIPQLWVEIEAIPLTKNGKLAKNELPDPEYSELSSQEYLAPRNEIEGKLASIWQELLGIEKVGVLDNFFELGGHSLLATRLVSMIRKEMHLEIPIRAVFTNPTVSELGLYLLTETNESKLPSVVAVEDRGPYIPLSFNQERLWFLDQLQGSREYHIPTVLRLSGKLDITVLNASFRAIVKRHEVLRTVLKSHEGVGYQHILSEVDWKLNVIKVNDSTLLPAMVRSCIDEPFDLSKEYTFRATLFDTDTNNYVLAGVFHHIASDGWSNGILIKEFVEIYAALKEGRKYELPDLSVQYVDYALWQRTYIEGRTLEKELNYWEQNLSGAEPLLLPSDFSRPKVQSTEGASSSIELNKVLTTQLLKLSQSQGVTLFMLLTAAFKVLLAKYSGQRDISIGSPIANRTQKEIEGLIGFFVNTLVLRSDLEGNPTFLDFLNQVKETTLGAYDHQNAPFEKIVERVESDRDISRSPLFQAMFVLQNTPDDSGDIQIDDLTLSPYAEKQTTSKFDLLLTAVEGDEVILLDMEYCTALFKEDTIVRMLGHFEFLLDSIATDPTKKIESFSLLAAAEQIDILREYKGELFEYPKDKTVIDFFEEQVERTPNAIALVFQDKQLSYRELNEGANQIAHYLMKREGKETLMGICAERSLEMILGVLAILKTGSCYVPIDSEHPEERILYMIEDSKMSFLLGDTENLYNLNIGPGVEKVILDDIPEDFASESRFNFERTISPKNLAYILYTSGSTGKPKGVLMPHGPLANLIAYHDTLEIPHTKVTQVTSIGFDVSFQEIFFTLTRGGELHVLSTETKKDLNALMTYVRNQEIEALFLPTSLFKVIGSERMIVDLPRLHSIVVAGEQLVLTPEIVHQLENENINLHNHYGPTEAHVVTTELINKKQGNLEPGIPSIGTPIGNAVLYILDDELQLQPQGIVGELCIGGQVLAKGYLNQPDLTKGKFIEDPFIKGGMIYKTGDLARWLPNGRLEYISRKDNQVKIRGYRVELGEIESLLTTYEAIENGIVVAKKDATGNDVLVGYVIATKGKVFDPKKAQEILKLKLPEYMVPQIWVELEYLPLNRNGKVDKKLLPEPQFTNTIAQQYVAPRNETEKALAQIWQELLGMEKVGIDHNFFEVGGHSILAMRLVSKIRTAFQIELNIRDVFIHPTIAEQGLHLATKIKTETLPTIVPQERKSHIPLSFSQERLWFIDQLQGSREYHMPMVMRIKGDLDSKVLGESLRKIVERHEILRTTIVAEEGIGYQKINPIADWELEVIQVSDTSNLAKVIDSYATKEFDLTADYMFRAALYVLGNQEFVLAGVFHHIASDGWSNDILIREFTTLYQAIRAGHNNELAQLPIQYADYAIWQRNYVEGRFLEAQLSYWEQQLNGLEPLVLPMDYSRPPIQSSDGAVFSFEIDESLSQNLRSLCQSEGVTLFMLLLAAFKVLLSKYSGQEDVAVGTTIANRPQEELEGLIGFFVNMLVIRTDLTETPSFSEFLKQVKEVTLEAYNNQSAPFEKVVDRVVTNRDMSRSPLFQVMFELQNATNTANEDIDLGEITLSAYEEEHATAKFDLTLSAADDGRIISFGLEYCTALFEESTVLRMVTHFKELLGSIITSPATPINALTMLPPSEEYQLLTHFNDTAVAYPLEETFISLFETQSIKTPTKIAAVFKTQKLTYKELDEKSNQVAHYLKEKEVAADSLVGICIDRSLEMLIGVIGILKAGGAYVPIKPDYPTQRISYIVNEIACEVLLTGSENILDDLSIDTNVELLVLNEANTVLHRYPTSALSLSIDPESLAYIIYTSGSTGQPKGAMIAHNGMLNHLLLMVDELQMEEDSTVAFTAPFTFDISVWQMLSGLLCGGKINIYSEETILDPKILSGLLKKDGVDLLQIVPSYLSSILDIENNTYLEKLRYLLVTGEAVQPAVLKKWFIQYANIPVVNAYGPTEAADDVTLHFMTSAPGQTNVSIGKPVANIQMYVVNTYDCLCPIGVVGELWVGGIGVGHGYLNDVEKTASSFYAKNPFNHSLPGRVYKTGDLGRWLPNGTLEYLGRKDDQVKIRGFRIELGEIENALSKQDAIKNCCIIAQKDANGNKRLVAYIVTDEATFEKFEIQEALKKELPEYMVPQLWVELTEMPLTRNGKIDKKALPAPDYLDLAEKKYVAPRDENEEKLVLIWQSLLAIDRVGVVDDFFELGGHSLLATRLVSMIRKETRKEISIRDIFSNTTIAELNSCLAQKSIGQVLPTIVAQKYDKPIPLSFSQERLWFLDQLHGSQEYHMPIVLRLSGAVNPLIIESAFKEIVNRHHVLRSVIKSVAGDAFQEVIPSTNWSMNIVAVTDSTKLEKMVAMHIAKPFDLSCDYMFRATLYDVGDSYVLSSVFHHIASDGWSENVLISEFMELYSSIEREEENKLPTLPIQYADYAVWQREYLSGDFMNHQLDYWEAQLANVAPLVLPTSYSRPAVQSTDGSSINFDIEEMLSEQLYDLCKSEGVTLFMGLTSAFKILLSKYSGQKDICIGTPIANRTQEELEGLIGFFVNTLVLRSSLEDDPTFVEYLQVVKRTTLEAYDHQSAPFEKVVDRVVKARDMSRSPLFQVMFVLQNTTSEADHQNESSDGLTITPYEAKGNGTTAKFDLLLTAEEVEGKVVFNMEYCTALFTEDFVQNMIVHFKNLLQSIVATPSIAISDLPMISRTEEEHLLKDLNHFQADMVPTGTVIDEFMSQVAKTPNDIALVCDKETLTYKELDQKSNELARYLIKKEVTKNDYVGICVERSIDMVLGVLAILKTGCGYLPIDMDYPEDRINYMLKDAKVSLLLAHAKSIENVSLNAQITTVLLDRDKQKIAQESGRALSKKQLPKPADICYVIYTSGSTGRPKGVLMPHRALANLMAYHDELGISYTKVTQFTSIGFDVSFQEIFFTLTRGGSLHIVTSELKNDFSGFVTYLRTKEIDTCFLPTSLFKVFGSEGMFENLPLLENIVVAGEQLVLTEDSIEQLRVNKITLHNHYGPSEAHVVTTLKLCESLGNLTPGIPSIGKPVDNVAIYILDEKLALQPKGIVGELCIGGVALADGYLNHPELTSEKFVTNPFQDQGMMYRTGDLARWLPDDSIEFLGRKDTQIKIRGYRVEIGEIESVLSEQNGIKNCCVLVKEDASKNKRLVGYVVIVDDFLDQEEIQKNLKALLPDYMIPTAWVILDEMPLNNNGKIARKSLPAPEFSRATSTEYAAPATKNEKLLVSIWEDLLGIEKVGIHDNFFEIGGYSILAIKLISQINKKFDKNLKIEELFKNQTVCELRERLEVVEESSGQNLVRIKEGNSAFRPIFCVPSVGGFAMDYFELAEELDDDIPFYSFQSPGLDGKSALSTSIEDMAATFIKEMQAIDPIGPYYIGGYSFAGIVAYEMAAQLEYSGYEVGEVLIFDSNPPGVDNKEPIASKTILNQIVMIARDTFDTEITLPEAIYELDSKNEVLETLYQIFVTENIEMLTNDQIKGYLYVYWNNFDLSFMYDPDTSEKLNTKISLFRIEDPLADDTYEKAINEDEAAMELYSKADYGWGEISNQEVAIHIIPNAAHDEVLSLPHVKQVATYLNTFLKTNS